MQPHEAGYSNNAMTVGGGTRVYGAQAWRFAPEDFRMASIYGVPEGSGLADWPIDYDTLAPWYARAEREIGVAGELGHAHHGARDAYPMQPFPLNPDGRVLRDAAGLLLAYRCHSARDQHARLRRTPRVRSLRHVRRIFVSERQQERHAQHGDPTCAGQRTLHLLTGAQVEAVICDSDGQARAVRMYVDQNGEVVERIVHARAIVIAAGAIETARLLLNSRSKAHAGGLGNAHDLVGRYLQGHLYSGAVGLYRETVQDCEGPGVSIATCEFSHGNPGIVGGGMLGNEFVPLPIHFWNSFAPSGPRWGVDAKRAFADAYRRTLVVDGTDTGDPEPGFTSDARPFGARSFRYSGCAPVRPRASGERAFGRDAADESGTMDSCGGSENVRSWGSEYGNVLSAGQHQAGTCRMGDDPRHSVADRHGRVHDQRALYWQTDRCTSPTAASIRCSPSSRTRSIGASLADALRA